MRKIIIPFTIFLLITVVFAAYEDFSTYTEVDTNTKITKTATTVTVSGINSNDGSMVYKDWTASYWSGDLRHWIDFNLQDCSDGDHPVFWMLSNTLDCIYDIRGSGSTYYMALLAYDSLLTLQEFNTTSYATDQYKFTTLPVTCYAEIERDDDGGAGNGILYARIFSNAARSVGICTLSVNLKTKIDYRYGYVYNGYDDNGSGSNTWTGWIANLDINPPVLPLSVGNVIVIGH